jgi:outer membrane protein TolC
MQRDQDLRAFEIAKAEIDAGGISQLDLLQAEADLIAAELSLAASDQTLGEDEVSVFRALGAG